MTARYCKPNCPHLDPTEQNQVKGEPHICWKYCQPVMHRGHHPKLIALRICDNDELEYAVQLHELFSVVRDRVIV